MPEQTGSKAPQPSFDPYKLLGQLKNIVNDNKKPSGGGKSWVGTLVIIVVVLAGIAVWSWISWRRGRELAKLRHEKEAARIRAERDAKLLVVARADAAIAEAEKRIRKREDELRVIDADIRAEEKRYEADLRAIRSIRSWSDAGVR